MSADVATHGQTKAVTVALMEMERALQTRTHDTPASHGASADGPVHVAFRNRGDDHDFLVITVARDEPVRAHGNVGWLDFRFEPLSYASQEPIGYNADPVQWARSLPGAYAETNLNVYLCPDPDVRRLNPAYRAPKPTVLIADPVAHSRRRAQDAQKTGKVSRAARRVTFRWR